MDITTDEGKRKIIDTFVNAIYAYDDHIEIIYNTNSKEESISLDEIESSTSFSSTSPNKNKTNLSSSFSFLTAHTCRIEPIFLQSKKLWAIMLTHYWFYFSQSEKQYLDFRMVLSLLAFWDRVRKFDERTFRSHTSEPSRVQYKHSF